MTKIFHKKLSYLRHQTCSDLDIIYIEIKRKILNIIHVYKIGHNKLGDKIQGWQKPIRRKSEMVFQRQSKRQGQQHIDSAAKAENTPD